MAIARNPSSRIGPALAVLGLAVLPAVGCTAFGGANAPANDTAVGAASEPTRDPEEPTPRTVNRVDVPPRPQPQDLLGTVDRLLVAGDYRGAADVCLQITADFPDSLEAARALFQLAVLHWNPASPTYDPAAAFVTLQRVTREYPDSPWAPAASAVLALSRDKASLERALTTLQAQLDELKALDLEPQG